MPESIRFQNSGLPDLIELSNIHVSYDNGKTFALEDIDLLIEDKPNQGQFISLLGPSGCGKSTILRLISGIQKPFKGEVKFKGKLQTKNDRANMIFQQYSSFPWLTVLDNIALGLKLKGIPKKERIEKAKEMVKIVGLEGKEALYAQYPTLSGGQLQRVAIGRALLADKEILLMDEAFGALDIITRLKMQMRVQDIWMQLHPTIILVTHDISEAVFLSEDVFFMSANPGKIIDFIHIGLPYPRTKEIKRSSEFIRLVQEVEEKMEELNAG